MLLPPPQPYTSDSNLFLRSFDWSADTCFLTGDNSVVSLGSQPAFPYCRGKRDAALEAEKSPSLPPSYIQLGQMYFSLDNMHNATLGNTLRQGFIFSLQSINSEPKRK